MSQSSRTDPAFHDKEPPLHRAARLGDTASIRSLVGGGADVNHVSDTHFSSEWSGCPASPLMVAAGSRDGATVETVNLLLELGADPLLETQAGTAATFACRGLDGNNGAGGDAERLAALLEAGSPLPADAEQRNRLVCDVASCGDAKRLRVLLDHGLSANAHWDPIQARSTALAMQESMRRYRATQPDIFASLSEEAKASLEKTSREIDEKSLARTSSAPFSDEIPLFRAAESGSAECIRMLLAAGADATARDNSKCTPMYFASSIEAVQALMAAGIPLQDANEYGWSPLVDAIQDGESALPRVRALLDSDADVNATHDRGYTVFMSAVGSGRYPVILRLLIAAGADPHAVSELGYNAFHAAIDVNGPEANTEDSVRDTFTYLKTLGVDIEARNRWGHTPLARAIESGTGTEVRVLCELGANPNAICPGRRCGNDGCTQVDLPLLFHATGGSGVDKDVKTQSLLLAGADVAATDPEGYRPLVRAVARLCSEAADYAGSFKAFFQGLFRLPPAHTPLPATRNDFLATIEPTIRKYVEEFAAGVAIPDYELAQQLRAERLSCIVSLCAHEAWRRKQP